MISSVQRSNQLNGADGCKHEARSRRTMRLWLTAAATRGDSAVAFRRRNAVDSEQLQRLDRAEHWGDLFRDAPNTKVTMRCWTDSQWFNGTNRWFKVDTVYGPGYGYMIATQVSSQTRVGRC